MESRMSLRHLVALTLTAGCSSGEGAESAAVCGDEAAVDTWAPGMTREGDGGILQFTLRAGDPSPPDKGDNVWTVALTAGGEPVTDSGLTLEPFMPEHGHGTNPASVPSVPGSEPGTYLSDPFYLFMGGVWEITAHAVGGSSGGDQATFTFCIEG